MMDTQVYDSHEKLARLMWLLQRDHMRARAGHGPMGDPSRGQGRVLAMLKLQPEIGTRDLSYLLGIRQQSLNELLNKLEKGGYIERAPAEADRRVMLVRLTEKGRQEPQEEPRGDDVFACLNGEERAALDGYLDRIIAALEEKSGGGDDDERAAWMRAARGRMGDERFDALMAHKGGRHHGLHGGPPGCPHGNPRDGRGRGDCPHGREHHCGRGPRDHRE